MRRNLVGAELLVGESAERRLESGDKLCLELHIDFCSLVILFYVAANVGVEEKRVCDFVGIDTAAANGNIEVETDFVINNTEENRVLSTELVVYELLGVEVVNSLVLCGVSAEGETLTDSLEGFLDAVAELARKD